MQIHATSIWIQSHKMLWAGKDLKHHLTTIPLLWAGSHPTRVSCPNPHPIWPEHFQGWSIHSFSGEVIAVPHQHHNKKFLLYTKSKFLLSQLEAFPPCPISTVLDEESFSLALLQASFRYWKLTMTSPCNLLQAEPPELLHLVFSLKVLQLPLGIH